MLGATLRKSYSITKTERVADALVLTSERGLLRLAPQNEYIIRVNYTETESFSDEYGLGIVFKGSFSDWTYSEDEAFVSLSTAKITAKVNKKTSSIVYYTCDGEEILREADCQSKYVTYYDTTQTVVDENTIVEDIVTPDGIKKQIKQATKVFDRRLCHTKLSLKFKDDEKIYGLGQDYYGVLNHRGTTNYLHQANMKICIPFFLSTAGYGILSGTDGVARFNDNNHGSYFYTDADTEMDFYFIYGPEFDDIIKGYRFLTGKAVMLPKWAFGYVQSQERYESQQEIIETVEKFEKLGLGIDCIVQDWNSWRPGTWGEKRMDPNWFPNVPEMIKTLEDKNVHFMLSIWSNPSTNTPDHHEFAENNLLLPASDNYDAFKEEGRKLYWKQVREGLFNNGVKSFWCDSSEPFAPEWRTEEPEVADYYHEYLNVSSQFMPRDVINAYGLVHSQTIYDGQRGDTDKYRVCNLTRSTFTGGQRYGAILWSGDISAKWDVYRNQIATGLNFCASGLPYWTLDIGAFFVRKGEQWFWNGDYNDTTDDLGYRELFTRWFQLGAFLPIFRAHGTEARREPWNYGEEGTMFYDAIKAAMELRYSLIPYIYSAAADVYFNDSTILRMLAFDFRKDAVACEIKDQFMFGKSIMVCPVTEPMYYGVNSEKIENADLTRKVYLPAGTAWFDFYTKERYEGGQWITVDADISKIPLFVKAGSIIPMTEPVRNTAESSKAKIEYVVFPGKDADFVLYEDEADGYGYEKGEYKFTKIHWNDAEQKLEIEE